MAARTRRRRWPWIVVPLVLVLVVGGAIGAELVVRSIVASTASERIRAALPEGVTADLAATPTGWCVSCEVIGGELSGLDLVGHDVAVGGLHGEVAATATRVAIRDTPTIGSLEGSITIGEDDLKALLDEVAAAQGIDASGLELADGGVRYRTGIELFGQTIDVEVLAQMQERPGGRVLVSAQQLSVVGPGGATTAIDLDPDALAFSLCLAEHLPAVLELTDIAITDTTLRADLRSTGPFVADEATLAELGSCPSA